MKQDLERLAADVLLESGIRLPIKNIFGRQRSVVVHAPTLGDMIRLASAYRQMGVTAEELHRMSFEDKADLMSRQGKVISRMVACGIVRLPFLRGVTAWWLRHFVHPVALFEIWNVMLQLIRTSPFELIIPSTEAMNLMKPTGSHSDGS